MGNKNSPGQPYNLQVLHRRQRCFDLRLGGNSYSRIAQLIREEWEREHPDWKLPSGWSERRAFKDVSYILQRRQADLNRTAEEVRTLELNRLDELLIVAWSIFKNTLKRNEEDEIIGCNWVAFAKVLDLMRRRASYQALDQQKPQQIDLTHQGTLTVDGNPLEQIAKEVKDIGDGELAQVVHNLTAIARGITPRKHEQQPSE